MKPNFALDFRNDAIALLHRTPRGWQGIGQVALDTADLAEALSYLRSTALGLSPKGMTTKLVIPNSQILYTRIRAGAPEAARRRKQVARGLEGLTPYAVQELAFDIWGDGPEVQVAVIAHETLAEAEAFAVEHRFNPVSFVAVPDAGAFAGEPWFGPTKFAATFLAEGERVERDQDPISILSRDLPVQEATSAMRAAVTTTGPIGGPTTGPAADPTVAPDVNAAPASPSAQPDVPAPAPASPSAEPDGPPPAAAEAAPALPGATAPAAASRSARRAAATAQAARPRAPTGGADVTAPQPVVAAAAAPVPDAPAQAAPAPDARAAPAPAAIAPPASRAGADEPFRELPVDASGGSDPREDVARSRVEEAPPAAAADPAAAPEPEVVPGPPVVALSASPVEAVAGFGEDRPVERPAEPMIDEAPIALDVVDDLPEPPAEAAVPQTPPPVGVLAASIDDDVPPPPAASVMMAFASRRAAEVAAKEAAAKEAAAKTGTAKAGPARTVGGKAPGLGSVTATRSGPSAKVSTLAPRSASPTVVAMPQRSGVPSATPAAAQPKPAVKGNATGKALRGLGALVTAPVIPGARERRAPVPAISPPTGPVSAASAAAATLARSGPPSYGGGLGTRGPADRRKPRYLGLILTGILLVFLALVAAWSTFFLEARNSTTAPPATVAEAVPTPDDEMLADLQGSAADLPPGETNPEPAAVAPPPVETVEAAPVTDLGSETATAIPLPEDLQDEIFLAAMDEPPAMPDAGSLPAPEDRTDLPPNPAVPPPPFGMVYQFDSAGQIIPTAEGVVTPEGVLLIAGRPKLLPPPRPAGLAPVPAATSQEAVDPPAGAVTVPTGPVGDDPALADPAAFGPGSVGARPRPRPEQAIPPTRSAEDDASLAPAVDSRFASLRPRTRPADLVPADLVSVAEARPPADPSADAGTDGVTDPVADLGAQAASLTAQAAASAAARSPLALAVSRKPAPRPKDMSRAVEAAVAVASRQPDPTPPVEEPKQKTETEADDEPEIARAMPRLPTKASVAKQATFVNAINLTKTNLIGVYGTPSNRYALIRQTTGRYKKVKVGDSFDGGRIAAITASEVRYQKSGKMLTLALPKS